MVDAPDEAGDEDDARSDGDGYVDDDDNNAANSFGTSDESEPQ